MQKRQDAPHTTRAQPEELFERPSSSSKPRLQDKAGSSACCYLPATTTACMSLNLLTIIGVPLYTLRHGTSQICRGPEGNHSLHALCSLHDLPYATRAIFYLLVYPDRLLKSCGAIFFSSSPYLTPFFIIATLHSELFPSYDQADIKRQPKINDYRPFARRPLSALPFSLNSTTGHSSWTRDRIFFTTRQSHSNQMRNVGATLPRSFLRRPDIRLGASISLSG